MKSESTLFLLLFIFVEVDPFNYFFIVKSSSEGREYAGVIKETLKILIGSIKENANQCPLEHLYPCTPLWSS